MKCLHCGRHIQHDDGTVWFHPDTMSARCDGPDDEEGLSWGDMVRQAEPDVGAYATYLYSFVDGYIECALWAGLDHHDPEAARPLDENHDADDLSFDAVADIAIECKTFIDENDMDLADIEPSQAGHDFFLTRNGHGAGYWDRGLGDIGDRLTKACKPHGTSELYVGDDGKLYAE